MVGQQVPRSHINIDKQIFLVDALFLFVEVEKVLIKCFGAFPCLIPFQQPIFP